jgi:hypothetical protein
MAKPIDYLFTERELSALFQDVPMPIEGRRRFVADYVGLKGWQGSTAEEVSDITVRINGIDVRLDEIESRLDDVEVIALMALMT